MRTIVRPLLLLLGTLASASTFAQEPGADWLVETMYSSGKINTVVAVVAVLIAGLAGWMFVMDKKLRRMEREQQHRN